ncbi:MAG: TIR domain-containing protein [Clostridiales bacterium]|nr:TIR domain-containing protein [Clostridiales bacterium]
MSTLKCKMCGGTLKYEEGKTVVECEYCGSLNTIPNVGDEKRLQLFDRANRLRSNCDFDKAFGVYEAIVAEYPEEAEAYWGLILCKYGIEYVDDPATSKKVPTCHRSSFDGVFDDPNFEMVMEYCDASSRDVYRNEAKQIEEIRKGIVEISSKEEPYDIFICYKETDDNGDRTIDSAIAQDVYEELTAKNYKVFFSRITLEDKLGQEYEPYIFAALNSAKVMLVFGTSYANYNAVWVKNEWTRFLKLMENNKGKYLIPCFKDIDAYDMPKEFSKLQAQDMGKVGAIQDLVRGIQKIVKKEDPKATAIVSGVMAGSDTVSALLKRASIFMDDSDWNEADKYYERVLDQAPENAGAYLGKLLVSNMVHSLDEYSKQLLNQSENSEPQMGKIQADTQHIENMVNSCTIKGYLEPDSIRKMYEYDQPYEITVPVRKDQKTALLSELKDDRFFSKASKYASGDIRTKIDSFIGSLTEALDERIVQAETYDSECVDSAQKEYASFIRKTDDKVLTLCESEKTKKLSDYKAIVERGRTCKTSAECDSAIKSLGAFAGYEDADAVIEELKSRCKELKGAEEKELKKKKNKTRNIVIIVASIVMIAVAVVLTFSVFIPNSKYNSAIALMNEGNYEEAIVAFTELNGYKDSSSKIDACKESILQGKYNSALALFDNKEYEQAITAFEELGEYQDSSEKILESKYQIAKALMDNEQYAEAIELFGSLGSYSDCEELLESCTESKKYNDAVSLMDDGQLLDAIDILEDINPYRDSQTLIETCKEELHNDAVSLINDGQYTDAYPILAKIGIDNDLAELLRPHYANLLISNHPSVGDCVRFGEYTSGKRFSTWTVLDVQGSQVLLLSTLTVSVRRFDPSSNDWNNSEIKSWLNSTYYNQAFTSQEQSMIVDKGYGKVFLLSIEEDRAYRGLYQISGNNFWLRSPGTNSHYAALDVFGSVNDYSIDVDRDAGVRPAIWIDVSQ